MLYEIILLAVGFVVGAVATFIFARMNRKKFYRYMTKDLDLLLANTQEEIRKVTDVEKAKEIVAKTKAKLDEMFKK